MLEISICDDEIHVGGYIEKIIEDISLELKIQVETDIFYDGKSLVNYIRGGARYDIIYLDIEMSELNGVEAAKLIREIDRNVLIIYITGYESFAKEVFEVSAFRFITKPINELTFRKYFLDAQRTITNKPKYFQYQYNKVSFRISVDNIMYFQSDRRVTYIITTEGCKKYYGKLNYIEKILLSNNIYFYRTHQSFLINPRFVSIYTYDSMELEDGSIVTIAENRRKKVSELFCSMKGDDIIV